MNIKNKYKDKEIFYKYKGTISDYPLVKPFIIDKVDANGNTVTFTIRKGKSLVFHLFVFLICIIPMIIIIYNCLSLNSNFKTRHILRIPNEFYYNDDYKAIDLDLTNDGSNLENVNISLYYNNELLLNFERIEPGESIGAIPLDLSKYKLPLECKLKYTAYKDNIVYSDVMLDVLIVDTGVLDEQFNNLF